MLRKNPSKYLTCAGVLTLTLTACGGGASDSSVPGVSANSHAVVKDTGGTPTPGDTTSTYSVLYSFGSSATDGKQPVANLIQATDGNFYGTTTGGGAHNAGTVFMLTPGGSESIFYSFADGLADGADPEAAPVQANDGNFYGTTAGSGSHDAGVLYKLTPAGTETVLHIFADGADGGDSTADLIQATDGSLYGTGSGGGLHSTGVLFQMTLGGTESVVYSFAGGNNASRPSSGLIQGSDGNFYGTTPAGGPSNNGVVYSVSPSGRETVLYTFTGGADGGTPYGRLVQASDGNFYGTTEYGGAHFEGVVFKVTPGGTESVLYSFANGADGAAPVAGLIQASDGNLYGTTLRGSHFNSGTVFQITLSGTETVIYAFQGGTDGAHPVAALLQGQDGNLYGTTQDGGTHGFGTVFKVTLP